MADSDASTRHGLIILLRRLRRPLLVLICVYAACVLGFVLVPGHTPDGQPWHMSFLQATYFVSFLGTTIGLGEIPYPFSDAQRLWATTAIYATVVAWLYAIGGLFALLQDPLFRRVLHESAVARSVRRVAEPFYLICGYDDAGHRVARELTEDNMRVVVIDIDQAKVDRVDIDNLRLHVPALGADASDPDALLLAGLRHPCCAGVVALTGSDAINTKVALTARLLNPALPILVVARDHAWHSRMAAAGADHIINPYDSFAERAVTAITMPSLHVLYEALTTQSGTATAEAPRVPRGHWLLCGGDLFTRTLRQRLQAIDVVVTTVAPAAAAQSGNHHITGDPTDPEVLAQAGLTHADALVAGTGEDIDNLSIALAARRERPDMFLAVRQTQRRNTPVFKAADADLVMRSSYVVAADVLRHLRAPLLSSFLRHARGQQEAWSAALLQQLREVVGDEVLESWVLPVNAQRMPAVCDALRRGEAVTLERLLTRTDGTRYAIHAVALLLVRDEHETLLPGAQTPLVGGDRVLFCGSALARTRMLGNALTRELAPLRLPLVGVLGR